MTQQEATETSTRGVLHSQQPLSTAWTCFPIHSQVILFSFGRLQNACITGNIRVRGGFRLGPFHLIFFFFSFFLVLQHMRCSYPKWFLLNGKNTRYMLWMLMFCCQWPDFASQNSLAGAFWQTNQINPAACQGWVVLRLNTERVSYFNMCFWIWHSITNLKWKTDTSCSKLDQSCCDGNSVFVGPLLLLFCWASPQRWH